MAIPDTITIWLPTTQSTLLCSASLKNSLYTSPCTICLQGDLGAGKTTFTQGFLQSLGVEEHITSPTYALEQRYNTSFGEVVHVDLYRLTTEQAQEFLEESDTLDTIRCIEWSDRAHLQGDIHIHLSDNAEQRGRKAHISFHDMPLPTKEEILHWRTEMDLPDAVCHHCDVVADCAEHLAKKLINKGIIVRVSAVKRAAEVHDLLRFIDFAKGAGHTEEQTSSVWEYWRNRYKERGHEEACADFLREKGYNELASIVAVHGLTTPSPSRTTIEQKLVFYADKRVAGTSIVTVEERFEDFAKRYPHHHSSKEKIDWLTEVKNVEEELCSLLDKKQLMIQDV